ncbi:hypothetical protein EEB14_61705, partial [Rhodococcus sp. WS4]
TDIQRAAGVGALFDTLTVFESYPIDQQGLAEQAGAIEGMTIEGVSSNDAPHYPLSLVIAAGAQVQMTFEYLQDVFDESMVVSFADRFVRILEAVTADPAVPVGEIEILDAVERDLVVSGWNDTGRAVGAGATLVSLFDARVARTPGAVAVVFEDEELTFGEFDVRVNRL